MSNTSIMKVSAPIRLLSLRLLTLFLICFSVTVSSSAQDNKADKKAAKLAQVKALVDSQRFDFIPQTAIPMSGPTRQLNGDYDLKVTKTTVNSYLPYYGRAYSAPINPSQNPSQFTSKDFDYTVTPRKKGGWDISIKPKDYRDVQQLSFVVSEDGYASLQVTYLSRQGMSFNGYLKPIKSSKHK